MKNSSIILVVGIVSLAVLGATVYWVNETHPDFCAEAMASRQNSQRGEVGKELRVGGETFDTLFTFFRHEAGWMAKDSHYCIRKYYFVDSKGTQHLFTARFNGDCYGYTEKAFTIKGSATKNINCPSEAFFGYYITPEKVTPAVYLADSTWQDADGIERGYKEFLTFAKTHRGMWNWSQR